VRVTNFSPGIPPDVRQRLFSPFSKSVQQAGRSAPGVGLGLALSRRLARAMGGDLRLEQTKAPGTKFTLTLKSTGTRL
jgi:signal transduction histidine kinase